MKIKKLVSIIVFLVLSLTAHSEDKLFFCDGDFDRTILGKTDLKIKGKFNISMSPKNITAEGSFFDGVYQVCNETKTIIWFEKACKKRKETDFKSSKDFVDYLLYTNTGGGYFNKVSGYLEIINLPFGMNDRERASYTGQFSCKKNN
jgi:hypothetical protein